MPHAANLPSIREIRSLADEFGIEMSDQEAQSYRMFMQGPINSYRRLKEFVVPQADTDSARTRLLPLKSTPGLAESVLNNDFVASERKQVASSSRYRLPASICRNKVPLK